MMSENQNPNTNIEENQKGESPAFQTGSRSRRKVVGERKWLTVLLLILLLLIIFGLYLAVSYMLKTI